MSSLFAGTPAHYSDIFPLSSRTITKIINHFFFEHARIMNFPLINVPARVIINTILSNRRLISHSNARQEDIAHQQPYSPRCSEVDHHKFFLGLLHESHPLSFGFDEFDHVCFLCVGLIYSITVRIL